MPRTRDDDAPRTTGLTYSKAAVEARWLGRQPSPVDFAEAEKQKGPTNPLCLLGAAGGAGCQGPMKGLNIPIIARAAVGDWVWLAQLCKAQRRLGTNLQEVNGADSLTYLSQVMKCYLLAQRELRRGEQHTSAEFCRLAYRSQIALLALAAVPSPRVRDLVVYGDGEQTYEGRKIDMRLPGVAVAGPRFNVSKEHERRSGLSTDNAAALLLRDELGTVDDLGLLRAEIEVAGWCIGGSPANAREVAAWCFGTMSGWWLRIRRVHTDDGNASEMVYGATERANGYKPSFAVAQMLPDGTLVRMTPAPSTVRNDGWGAGDYRVETSDGVIHAQCGTGEASLDELRGEVVWQVDINGTEVRFS